MSVPEPLRTSREDQSLNLVLCARSLLASVRRMLLTCFLRCSVITASMRTFLNVYLKMGIWNLRTYPIPSGTKRRQAVMQERQKITLLLC